jgi:hypothetical protein
MNTTARLSAFASALAVVLAAGYGVGTAAGPVDADTSDQLEAADHSVEQDEAHAASAASSNAQEDDVMGGLTATEDGYTLVTPSATVPAGLGTFTFEVIRPDGQALTDYEVEHEKELHLIAVRTDGAGFQHVHPVRDDNGQWSVDLDLRLPGAWRVFADFVPAGAEQGLTLGMTVHVAGDPYAPRPVAEPSQAVEVDGLRVELAGAPVAGRASSVEFAVSRDGQEVTPDPYLGARGHLVALRDGDLAYLHVHPDEDELSFMATFPTPGRYLLYLDFSVDGTVRTAPFTVDVTP